MKNSLPSSRRDFIKASLTAAVCSGSLGSLARAAATPAGTRRYLYVAVPAIRNYLERGGHGILVFDIDNGHKFVKRIPAMGLTKEGRPQNVKGCVASGVTGRIYVSTLDFMACTDMVTDKILWEKNTRAAATAWPSRPTARSFTCRGSRRTTGSSSTP